jgi:hypothetical protein
VHSYLICGEYAHFLSVCHDDDDCGVIKFGLLSMKTIC